MRRLTFSLRGRASGSSAACTRVGPRAGFTLVELAVVIAIFSVSVMLFLQTMVSSSNMDPISSETRVAAEAARIRLEEMRATNFDQIFKCYNDYKADDPAGPGTAPGAWFAVEGLTPPPGAQAVGHVLFPSVGNQLREDVANDEISMPRDLNNDGLVDNLDHANDAIILPVTVRLEWASKTGRQGKRNLVLYAMFPKL